MMFHFLPRWLAQALEIIPALVIAIVAILCWRRYWSIRFWLAAAFLYWFIPWGNRAISNAGNGIGIRHPLPGWLVDPFYAVTMVGWLLVFALMALGLLSFHPRTRWVDTARFRNHIVAGCGLVVAGVLVWFSWKGSQPTEPRPARPLNPATAFSPERPISPVVSAHIEPTSEVFRGTYPQFRVTLKNIGAEDIHLGELPLGRFKFDVVIFFTGRSADDRDQRWAHDLPISRNEEVLPAGGSRTFVTPATPEELWSVDDGQPLSLVRGSFTAFVGFFLRERGVPQRVVSNVVSFRIE